MHSRKCGNILWFICVELVREGFCSHKLLAQTAMQCNRSCDLTALWALKENADETTSISSSIMFCSFLNECWNTRSAKQKSGLLSHIMYSNAATKSNMHHFKYQYGKNVMAVLWILSTYQFDDLNENPVVGRGGHEFEEERGQRQVVLRVSSCQLTNYIYCCRLDT